MRLETAFILSIVLLVGCVAAPAPTETAIPSVTPTLVASSTPTLQPTGTATTIVETATITPVESESPTPLPVTVVPVIQTDLVAPVRMQLPDNWLSGNGALPLQEGIGIDIGFVPFSVYTGPVTGGEATITLIWGFRNITPAVPIPGQEGQVDLWLDGLRLLYTAVLESECTIGRDERRTFSIGGREAIGGYFAADNCPELPDTRGWFVVLQEEDINFAFYVYTEPMEVMDGEGRQELQAILDSVTIDMSLLPTPEPGE